MTTDIRERVAEVLAGMPLHELTKPERDYFLRAAAFLLEAFPQIAETEWEYGYAEVVVEGDKEYIYGSGDGFFATPEEAKAHAVEDSDVIVRRRRAGEWEVCE